MSSISAAIVLPVSPESAFNHALKSGDTTVLKISSCVALETNRHVLSAWNGGRGRDAGYPAPPAQIRTGPIKASGSYLGCLAAKRTAGQG